MTQIFATDENNDWFLSSTSNLTVVTGLSAVLQQCEHVMKVIRGELIFAINRGVLGFKQNEVFGNTPNLLEFENRARTALLGVADVTEIVSFDFEVINNVLTYTANIQTIYGPGKISDEIKN